MGMSWIFVRLSHKGLTYPPYSSFSSEPKGLRAIYECYSELNNINVERSFKSFEKTIKPENCLHIGAALQAKSIDFVPKEAFESLDSTIRSGSTLLLTINPKSRFFSFLLDNLKIDSTNNDSTKKDSLNADTTSSDLISSNEKDETYSTDQIVSFSKKWNFYLKKEKLETDSITISVDSNYSSHIGNRYISKSPFFFDVADSIWEILATRKDMPVLIRRELDKGTLILSSDTYFLTNESLAYNRNSQLLYFLAKDKNNIIFHEAHLGLIEKTGIIDLMNKYGITGLFIGIVILFLLYVWKSTNPIMVLKYSVDETNENKSTYSKFGGLSGMIYKHTKKEHIIDTSISEWLKSKGTASLNKIEIKKIKDIDNKSNMEIIDKYNSICKIIKKEN